MLDIYHCIYLSTCEKFECNKKQILLSAGSADLNAIFHGPRREESNCGGLDTPSSSCSIGNGSCASGSLVSQRSSACSTPRKHIIQVSTYQMCVLMLFNKRERLTYEVSSLAPLQARSLDATMYYHIYIFNDMAYHYMEIEKCFTCTIFTYTYV